MIEGIPMECIIVDSSVQKALIPVYDDTIKEGLRVFEAAIGGKFMGWKDPSTNIIYKPGKEAYPKPELPYDLFGVECGNGWHKIIQPILDYIENYNKENPECPIIITQIKEKFGGLEIYVDNKPPELAEMIRNARAESFRTCEFCGDTTDVGITTNIWYTTMCRNCAIETSKENKHWRRKWKSLNDGKTYIIEGGNIKVSE